MNLAVFTVCKFHEDGEGFVNTGDEAVDGVFYLGTPHGQSGRPQTMRATLVLLLK